MNRYISPRWYCTRLFLVIALTVINLGTMTSTAEAVTLIRVDSNLDSNNLWHCTPAPNDCSLRGAIRSVEEKNIADARIVLPSNPVKPYRLQLGQIVIRRSLTIRGETNAADTIIDGLEKWRVIYIEGASSPTVDISNVTIQFGKVESEKGGGIFVEEGAILVLTRSIVQFNKTVNAHQQPGGGIYNEGQLRIVESLISNNSVPLDFNDGRPRPKGGGIHNADRAQLLIERSTIIYNMASHGGGIANEGNMTIVNSTISGNYASVQGGGIWNVGTGTIIFSTITKNSRTVEPQAASSDQHGGGGIYNGEDPDSGFPGSLSMGNTILAENFAGGSGDDCLSNTDGDFTSLGGNLIEVLYESQCNLVRQDNDQIGGGGNITIDPKIDNLAFNGGPTLTHALLEDSPAIDRGINGDCPSIDQRGFVRPLDGDGDKTARCDVGAFETSSMPLDDFAFGRHPNGRLGTNWAGDKTKASYFISNEGLLEVETGGPIYWSADSFDNDQHAFITLVHLDPNGMHSLLLKVQGIWQQGAIRVFYNAPAQRIGIRTIVPGQGWVTLQTFPRVLKDGDQLGARAQSDGIVHVYLNSVEIGSADAGFFFAGKGGRVGLWFMNAPNALLDDFVGATIAP